MTDQGRWSCIEQYRLKPICKQSPVSTKSHVIMISNPFWDWLTTFFSLDQSSTKVTISSPVKKPPSSFTPPNTDDCQHLFIALAYAGRMHLPELSHPPALLAPHLTLRIACDTIDQSCWSTECKISRVFHNQETRQNGISRQTMPMQRQVKMPNWHRIESISSIYSTPASTRGTFL